MFHFKTNERRFGKPFNRHRKTPARARRLPVGQGTNSQVDTIEIIYVVKTKEKKERAIGGLFDGIPPQLSALRYALDIAKKADPKTLERAAENAKAKNSPALKIGRAMFELVRKAAAKKVEPEAALRDYILEIRAEAEKEGK